MSKKKANSSGLVYSTDPGFRAGEEHIEERSTLPAGEQLLKVKLDTKQRAGKVVTTIDHFSGTNDDLETLEKKLKTFCGTGGSVKDGLIIIQGDHREKVLQWLQKNGYTKAKRL